MVQQYCQEEITSSEIPVEDDVFSEKLQGESGESQPAEIADDAEVRADFWSSQWTPSPTLCAEGRNIPYCIKNTLT